MPNHPIIIAMWYSANDKLLKIYANFLVANFFRVMKEKPRKKNSSSSELTKDMYIATQMKFDLFTPVVSPRLVVRAEKSNTFLKAKYAPSTTT